MTTTTIRRALAPIAALVLAMLFTFGLAGTALAGPADHPAVGPDDLQVCVEDCGGDDGLPPDWGPDDILPCTEDCGPDEGTEEGTEDGGDEDGGNEDGGNEDGGNEDGGAEDGAEDGDENGTPDHETPDTETPEDEIPVPTRIDTGLGTGAEQGHDLWLIGAVAALVGTAVLTYRAIRDRS